MRRHGRIVALIAAVVVVLLSRAFAGEETTSTKDSAPKARIDTLMVFLTRGSPCEDAGRTAESVARKAGWDYSAGDPINDKYARDFGVKYIGNRFPANDKLKRGTIVLFYMTSIKVGDKTTYKLLEWEQLDPPDALADAGPSQK
jgi:hypothetical protein